MKDLVSSVGVASSDDTRKSASDESVNEAVALPGRRAESL